MKCSDIIKILQETAPESCACDWDNPGLLAGRSDPLKTYQNCRLPVPTAVIFG